MQPLLHPVVVLGAGPAEVVGQHFPDLFREQLLVPLEQVPAHQERGEAHPGEDEQQDLGLELDAQGPPSVGR